MERFCVLCVLSGQNNLIMFLPSSFCLKFNLSASFASLRFVFMGSESAAGSPRSVLAFDEAAGTMFEVCAGVEIMC